MEAAMSGTAQPIAQTARPGNRSSPLLDPAFVRRAGRATLLAVVTLGLSAVALSLYFGGAGEIFGPVNDALLAATFALLAPAVEAVRQLARGAAGRWFGVASAAALAGIATAAVGQVLLIVGLLPLAGSFVTLGVGALLFVGWTVALAVISLRHGVLGRAVGWWAAALVAATVVTTVGTPLAGLGTAELSVVFGIPLLAATVGLLVALGRDLLRRT
jgi:hypothetical protein